MSDTLEHDKQQRLLVAKALKQASKDQNGFGGNCAAVAYILDHVLQAEGDYVVVNGEHYEFADHVFLRWKDRLWDMGGMYTPAQAQALWESEDHDGSDDVLEDYPDSDGSSVLRLADNNGVFAGGFDPLKFHRELTQALAASGFELAEEALEPPSGLAYTSSTPRRRTGP